MSCVLSVELPSCAMAMPMPWLAWALMLHRHQRHREKITGCCNEQCSAGWKSRDTGRLQKHQKTHKSMETIKFLNENKNFSPLKLPHAGHCWFQMAPQSAVLTHPLMKPHPFRGVCGTVAQAHFISCSQRQEKTCGDTCEGLSEDTRRDRRCFP